MSINDDFNGMTSIGWLEKFLRLRTNSEEDRDMVKEHSCCLYTRLSIYEASIWSHLHQLKWILTENWKNQNEKKNHKHQIIGKMNLSINKEIK